MKKENLNRAQLIFVNCSKSETQSSLSSLVRKILYFRNYLLDFYMDSHHLPRHTFHNLCIVASVDDIIQQEEYHLLLHFAEAMGIEKEEAIRLITHVGKREPIIPESEPDRVMEIRMLAMIAAADGVIAEEEKDILSKMALLMEVEQSVVDQAVDFHLKKEKKRLLNRSILHNLYLIAKADGELTEEELNLLLEVAFNLSLAQEEISMVLDHKLPDVFTIPEDSDERWFSLKNLVFMMVIDGEISEIEYDLCLKYAEAAGLGEEEIEDILDEYQAMVQVETGKSGNDTPANQDAILDTFAILSTIETPVEELVDQFEKVLEEEELPQTFDADPVKNRACLELMWLMFVWAPMLSEDAATMIPLHMDLAMAKGTWRELRDYLMQLESERGDMTIPFVEWEVEDLVKDLVEG